MLIIILSVSSTSFVVDLGRKISERTGDPLEVQFLFQRISVLIQRFNSVLFTRLSQLRTIPTHNHSSLFLILVFNLRDLYFLGVLKK